MIDVGLICNKALTTVAMLKTLVWGEDRRCGQYMLHAIHDVTQ